MLGEKTVTKLSEAENTLLSLLTRNFVLSIALLRWKYGRKKWDRECNGGYTTRLLRGRRQWWFGLHELLKKMWLWKIWLVKWGRRVERLIMQGVLCSFFITEKVISGKLMIPLKRDKIGEQQCDGKARCFGSACCTWNAVREAQAGPEGTVGAQAAEIQERSSYECSERWCLILISFTPFHGRNCSTGVWGISQLETGGGFRTFDSLLKRNVLPEMWTPGTEFQEEWWLTFGNSPVDASGLALQYSFPDYCDDDLKPAQSHYAALVINEVML